MRTTIELKTPKVQVWRNGVMMGLRPLEEVKKWVAEGNWVAFTDQSIMPKSEAY